MLSRLDEEGERNRGVRGEVPSYGGRKVKGLSAHHPDQEISFQREKKRGKKREQHLG